MWQVKAPEFVCDGCGSAKMVPLCAAQRILTAMHRCSVQM